MQKFFVKRLILPSEHGAWVWLLVPYGVGITTASYWGEILPSAVPALLLTLVAGLAVFLLRQPTTVWLRIQRGRGNPEFKKVAMGWIIGLSIVALGCLAGLLAMGRTDLWLGVGVSAILFLLYLYANYRGRAALRALWMELVGAAGLSLMAPMAIMSMIGKMPASVWGLWLLIAAQNSLSLLYVRLRLADTHGKTTQRGLLLLVHGLVSVVVGTAGILQLIPLLTFWLFFLLTSRAVWVIQHPRPVSNIRHLGFLELGVALFCGLWFIISYQ